MQQVASFLQNTFNAIRPWAEELGGPGLVLIAFLDSSFLSLPEINDALVVLLVIQEPSRWPLYAAAATLGSVAGCLALYTVGRKGGEAFLQRRFHARHLERGLGLFRKYGVLAIIIPSLLPPPMPFKIFVLLSGVAGVRIPVFAAAVAVGRGTRYGVEAWLAYRYGAQAMALIREHMLLFSVLAAVIMVALVTGVVIWRKRARAA